MFDFCRNQNFSIYKSKNGELDDSIYGGIKYLLSYSEKMLTQKGKKLQKKNKNLEIFFE